MADQTIKIKEEKVPEKDEEELFVNTSIVKEELPELPQEDVPMPLPIKEELNIDYEPEVPETLNHVEPEENGANLLIKEEFDDGEQISNMVVVKYEAEDSEYISHSADTHDSAKIKIEAVIERLDDDVNMPKLVHVETLRDDCSEQILPNDYDNGDMYILNSITNNELTLQEQIINAHRPRHLEMVPCTKCSRVLNRNSLTRHMNMHTTIERRAVGIMKALKTKALRKCQKQTKQEKGPYTSGTGSFKCSNCCKKYLMKKSLLRHQRLCGEQLSDINEYHCSNCGEFFTVKRSYLRHQKNCQPHVPKNDISKVHIIPKDVGEYLCSCGKAFHRRSRMETCLRSHTDSIQEASVVKQSRTNQGMQSCPSCPKQFQNKNELAAHRKLHARKRYPCKFCPLDFHTPKELFKHLRKHQKVQQIEYEVVSAVVNGKEELKCFMCSKTCKELSELKLHVLGDHKEPYTCSKCQESFRNIIDFASHTKNSHPEVEGQSVLSVIEAFSKLARCWKCEECDLQFDEPKTLALHRVEQHTMNGKTDVIVPEYLCPYCSRMFLTSKRLATHLRMIHNLEENGDKLNKAEIAKSLMCMHCRKVCKDENALACHMRLHSPERKYVCKFCDFRFATNEKRKEHSIIHTGEMKYVCFICEYVCTSENRLKIHKESGKHINMKRSLLDGVPYIENSKEKIVPQSSLSEEASVCDVCSESFTSESEMLEHKKVHPFIEFPNEDQPAIFFK